MCTASMCPCAFHHAISTSVFVLRFILLPRSTTIVPAYFMIWMYLTDRRRTVLMGCGVCSCATTHDHACMTRRHSDRTLAEQIRHDETSHCWTHETRKQVCLPTSLVFGRRYRRTDHSREPLFTTPGRTVDFTPHADALVRSN